MPAQPYGLEPGLEEFYVAENVYPSWRMYHSEKKARQYAYTPAEYLRDENGRAVRDENGKAIIISTPTPRVFKVKLTWEEIT